MTLELSGLHPALRPYAEYTIALGRAYGLDPVVTSVSRSYADQVKLRSQYEECLKTYGRTGPDLPQACKYPANQPGDSSHNRWLAIDGQQGALGWDSSVPVGPERDLWTEIRKAVGWRVPENDLVHAELPNWRSYVVGLASR